MPIQIQKLSLRGSDSTWVGDSQGSRYNDNPPFLLFFLFLEFMSNKIIFRVLIKRANKNMYVIAL